MRSRETTSRFGRECTRMQTNKKLIKVLLGVLLPSLCAQESELGPQPSSWPKIARPYNAAVVPPIRLANSSRLQDLIRAGNLYLTIQDAIALAIENNLDLEIERYNPLLANWDLVRQSGGGPLRGAGGNNAQVGQVASGQGVNGSEASAGLLLANGGSGGGGGGSGAGVIQQVGATAPNYDPTLTNATTFSHVTSPQPDQVVSQIPTLVQNTRSYTTQIQQGLVTGGVVRIQQVENYLNENAPSDLYNPSVAPRVVLSGSQPLLQGMGTTVNTYYIRVAQNRIGGAHQEFRRQLLNLVASVSNLYWDVVSANESVKAAQQSLDIAQKFDDDTRQRVRLGTLAGYQVPRADAQLAKARQALESAQMQLQQSEQPLKEAISRVEDPLLEEARIVTLDRIEVPATDELRPLRELIAGALAKRPDVAVAKVNSDDAALASVGTTNNLLPYAVAYGATWNLGAAPGLGSAFGQVARRDYPNQYAGVYLSIPLNNRFAQGEYGLDQLQLQQTQLSMQRDRNEIAVQISNQAVALKRARASYQAASSAREFQEQLLKAEQDKFSFGSSSIDNIVRAQNALVAAQSAEVGARSAFVHTRAALDQTLGDTLEVNHVTLEEGESGHVAK
jgi:outer membrane protein